MEQFLIREYVISVKEESAKQSSDKSKYNKKLFVR